MVNRRLVIQSKKMPAKHRSTHSEKQLVKAQKDLYMDMDDYMDDKVRNMDKRTTLGISKFLRNSYRYNKTKKTLGTVRQRKAMSAKVRKDKMKQSASYKEIKADAKKASAAVLSAFPDLPISEILTLVILMSITGRGGGGGQQPAQVSSTTYAPESNFTNTIGDVTSITAIAPGLQFGQPASGTNASMDVSSYQW